jgi:hypothetical protein
MSSRSTVIGFVFSGLVLFSFLAAERVAQGVGNAGLQGSTAMFVNRLADADNGDKDSAPEPQDFETRCRAAGVLTCVGFDSPEEVAPAKDPGSGLYPADDGKFHGEIDTSIVASGTGSLKFTIPSYSGPNSAGFWKQAIGRNLGEGTTFYVQFRQRFSPEMLKNTWGVDTYWKQIIIHNGPQTCSDYALTTINEHGRGFPSMYSHCGADSFFIDLHNGDYLLEQGEYNCHYHDINSHDCFMYPADKWITFYYRIDVGHWGKPDSAVQAWISLPGNRYRQWIDMKNHVLAPHSPGEDYDTVTLLAYMTNKDRTKYGGPVAYTWYDELIVSSRPIAPPK